MGTQRDSDLYGLWFC